MSYGKHNNYHKNTKVSPSLSPIKLDYKNNPDLFDKEANKWAGSIKGTHKTQMRNFYDQVLDFYKRSKHTNDFKGEILPFVKMLNSKVTYAKNRKKIGDNFQNMMEQCIKQVNTKEDLEVFKLFFEAVLGFYK